MIVARNDSIERVAEAILNVIILIFTILATLLHVVWMLVLAVHRSVGGIDVNQGHRVDGIMDSIRATATASNAVQPEAPCTNHPPLYSDCRVASPGRSVSFAPGIAVYSPVCGAQATGANEQDATAAHDAAPGNPAADPANVADPATAAPAAATAPNNRDVSYFAHVAANEVYDVDDGNGGAWYAVIRGRRVGVVQTWTRAGSFVIGVPNNLAQRFDTRAQAVEAYLAARRNREVRVML